MSQSFQQIASSVKENCKPFVDIAQGKNISYTQAILESVTDYSDREKYQHADVSKHILASDGLRTSTVGRSVASPVKDFEKAYQQNFLFDYWDSRYDRGFYQVPGPMQAQFNDPSTLSGMTAGEAWRLFTDMQPRLAVLEPDIPMTAIVNFNVPSASLAGRIPEIIIRNSTPQEMEEGAAPKKGVVKFRKGTVDMDKSGILLEISRESSDNQDVSVDIVGMFMERAGVEDEIQMVNGLIKIVKDKEKVGDITLDVKTINLGVASADMTGRHILEIQAAFGRGKRADRVLGKKAEVLDYVDALARAFGQGAGTYGSQDGTTTAGQLTSQPVLINAQSRPTLAGYLDGQDATDAGLENNKLYLIDSRNTLGVLTHQNDPYTAENVDVIRAVHQHVLTRWHAGFLQVDAPIAEVTFAP